VTTPLTAPAPAAVRAASRATYAAFIAAGFAFASWASRIPSIKHGLHLSPAQLGQVLLVLAVGAVISLPLAGPLVGHLGSRRVVTGMALLLAVGLSAMAGGYLVGAVALAAGGFVLGFANGAWDVAMNVQGALVERHLGYSIMSRYHAGFSVGTVAGALLGSAMIAVHVPVTAHLIGVAVLVAATVPWLVRDFLPEVTEAAHEDAAPIGHFAGWREPRTLFIGLFVLAFAFGEGTGNDWVAVALNDGYDLPAAVGTLGFAVFLTAMTGGRWIGPALLDRYGRVPVLRALTAVALAGLGLFVFGHWPVLAFAGALLWGFGVSLGFPVGMSAGADEPAYAASRVSVISSIGYCAFLGGPPLVGFLGEHITVLRGLLAVAVLLGIAMLVVGNVRPPQDAPPPIVEP